MTSQDHCPSHSDPPPGCPFADPPRIASPVIRFTTFLVGLLACMGAAAAPFRSHDLPPMVTASCLAGAAWTLFYWRVVDRRSFSSIGIPFHRGVPNELFRGGLAAAWLVTLASLPSLLAHPGTIRLAPDGWGAFWRQGALYAGVFVLVALNEETSIRGYVFRNLLLKVSPAAAVVLSSVLFVLLHVINPGLTWLAVLNLLLAGAFMAFSVLRWGSLWYALGFHFLWNWHQGVVLSRPVSGVSVPGLLSFSSSGPAWLTGGAFGTEGSILTTFLLSVACLRMARGLPIDLMRSPTPPPCVGGEICPAVPEEIRAAAERWVKTGAVGEIISNQPSNR